MRIHPTLLTTRGSKWQFPAAFALLLFLVAVNVTRGPREMVIATPQPLEQMVDVVVAQQSIESGSPLEKAALQILKRPISTLPADVISTMDLLKNKVAAGPIPAGYPLARALLADPVAVIPVSAAEEAAKAKANDPIDTLLEEIKKDTVAVPLMFPSEAPGRGTRVALALSKMNGDTVLVLEEAWVSESQGQRATLRVDPKKALFIQNVKRLGQLSFIEIPTEGDSPYAGHAVQSMQELEDALGGKTQIAKSDTPANRKFRSYAWVSGAGVRYGIGDDGTMYMVDGTGHEVSSVMPDSFTK